MYLDDILDTSKLAALIADKRIQSQFHPTLPLRIYNYTNRAQFANEWTHEERVCRGLIVEDSGRQKIIARGPSKFFNYGQPGSPEVSMDTQVAVTTKEDGSLGIGWYYKGSYGVATRGSFASDQAVHASALLTEEDRDLISWGGAAGQDTRIYEIVYPENRIVLDYKGLDALLPLGTVSNETGLINGRVKDSFSILSFSDAVSLRIPEDQEGYVLDILDDNGFATGHLKLKGDRYKELHGAIFGLSERKIWESIGRGENMEEFVSSLPDELIPWAQSVVNRLTATANTLKSGIFYVFQSIERRFGVENLRDVPRGEVARYIVQNHKNISGPLFSLLDNRDEAVAEWVHKEIRPEHRLFRVESEDTN